MAKKPGLKARSASVKASKSTAQDDHETPTGKTVAASLRLDPERHEALRTIAFNTRRSIHSLLLEGVDAVLKKHGSK